LITFTLLVVGGQQGCQKEKATTFNTTSLAMAFVEDAPSKELVPRQTYPVYVDISNQGGADIAAGAAHFYLSGFSTEVLKNVNLHVQNANFLAKKTAMQEGGKERLTFATAANPMELQTPSNFTMKVDSCYKYLTSVNTKICIGKTGTICNITSEKIKTGDSSSGPIQIKSITESLEGDRLYVKALITNQGTGEVYLPNANCDLIERSDPNENLKRNMVEVDVKTESGFKCNLQTLEAPHSLVEGVTGMAYLGQLTCSKTLGDESMRESPFSADISYIYKQSMSQGFRIIP
jgi:hypothetical protein